MSFDAFMRAAPGVLGRGLAGRNAGIQQRFRNDLLQAESDQRAQRLMLEEALLQARMAPPPEAPYRDEKVNGVGLVRVFKDGTTKVLVPEPGQEGPEEYTLTPGGRRYRGSDVIAENPYRPRATGGVGQALDRRRWVATKAQELYKETVDGPADPKSIFKPSKVRRFKSLAEAKAEAEAMFDELYGTPASGVNATRRSAPAETNAMLQQGQGAVSRFMQNRPATATIPGAEQSLDAFAERAAGMAPEDVEAARALIKGKPAALAKAALEAAEFTPEEIAAILGAP